MTNLLINSPEGSMTITRLGNLRSLRISSDGEVVAEKGSDYSMKGAKTMFTPVSQLKEMFSVIKIEMT